MRERDRMEIEILVGCFLISAPAGVAFGLWQESWAAGAFMLFFTFIMQAKK